MPSGVFRLDDVPPRTMLEVMVQEMYAAWKNGTRKEFVAEKVSPKTVAKHSVYNFYSFIRDTTFLALLVYTGVRISEVIGRSERDMRKKYKVYDYNPADDCIRVQDLDMINRRLRIPQRKKRVGIKRALRRITIVLPPLRPILVDRIKEMELKPYHPLMAEPRNKKRPINRNTARSIVYRRTKAYLGKPIRPHAIRHAFATELIRRGVNVEAIRRILGHSSLSVTQIYLDLTLEDLRGVMEAAFGAPSLAMQNFSPYPMQPYPSFYPQPPPQYNPYYQPVQAPPYYPYQPQGQPYQPTQGPPQPYQPQGATQPYQPQGPPQGQPYQPPGSPQGQPYQPQGQPYQPTQGPPQPYQPQGATQPYQPQGQPYQPPGSPQGQPYQPQGQPYQPPGPPQVQPYQPQGQPYQPTQGAPQGQPYQPQGATQPYQPPGSPQGQPYPYPYQPTYSPYPQNPPQQPSTEEKVEEEKDRSSSDSS